MNTNRTKRAFLRLTHLDGKPFLLRSEFFAMAFEEPAKKEQEQDQETGRHTVLVTSGNARFYVQETAKEIQEKLSHTAVNDAIAIRINKSRPDPVVLRAQFIASVTPKDDETGTSIALTFGGWTAYSHETIDEVTDMLAKLTPPYRTI